MAWDDPFLNFVGDIVPERFAKSFGDRKLYMSSL